MEGSGIEPEAIRCQSPGAATETPSTERDDWSLIVGLVHPDATAVASLGREAVRYLPSSLPFLDVVRSFFPGAGCRWS